ncbi:insulinase family protein [uncultured Tyzzerella sp.]|uniref:insulinase family protein n=1 Tax=uncultured Tyzzerella sp. TaxID=2321398 RepID=UPI002943590F|nr:insulinase family protein [uncultured Tyzzerella sp.]
MTYNLLKKENIDNIGEGYLYEHIKTGAKVVYIKNNDKNKVFSVSFRTLPKNNTGVFHILEHCVLCGSKKYPLKEPFNQLDKCTINTYLNAITFADKTLYPIASPNDKDYFKLLDVYLDAVFFPLIENKKGIFLQEGWHYNGKEINGVVYNEMKGVYSTPDAIIDFKVKEKLFNNGYEYDSGGHPSYITDITYDNFIKTYKKYYNPSNSIIYFYGDLDIDYYLNYLDKEYLSKFNKCNINIIEKSVDLNKPIIFEDFYYTDEDLEEEKNYIQASFKMNFSKDEAKNIAFDILSDILTENQEGILKKALVDAGVCTDVTSYIDDDMLEPVYTILIEGTKEDSIEKFKNILENTIKNINIDEKLIEGGIATNEFYFKEKDFGYKPEGLFYNIILLKNMLYGKYDFDILKFDKLIEDIKHIDFKNLLIENTINNNNAIYCILKPTDKKQNIDNKNYTENTKYLLEYQKEIDKIEDIEKIPPLKIEDIEKDIFKINTEILNVKHRPLIYNNINSEISYFNMVVDISSFSETYGKYISIYVYLLGKLDTKNYTSEKLEQAINILIGGGSTYNGFISLKDDKFFNALGFSARILNKNIEKAFNIINEIFKNTIFDNEEKLKSYILEFLYKCELDILKDPKQYSIKRAKSYICKKSLYIENVEGIEFYNWLKDLCKDIDKNIHDIIKNLLYIKDNILNINNVYFGIGCNKEAKNVCFTSIEELTIFNENKITNSIKEKEKLNIKNEAFYISSDVNYNTKVAFLNKVDFKYTGYLDVLKRIIQSDYMWYKIRTEGGAYGGDISISDSGLIVLNSYSDPNILKTYDNFNKIPDYIKNLSISEKELHMYKIGTINILDRPMKNYEINQVAMNRYFKQLDEKEIYTQRQQVLDTNINHIKDYFEVIKGSLAKNSICTIGNKEDINLCKNIFFNVKRFN